MIRVAIADDSPFTCNLLASYIESGGDCTVVGVAHDAQSTLDLIGAEAPDVLTLDLQMPGVDGLDLLQQLSTRPWVSVVVISGVTRLAAATTLRALELGAVDFILKYTPGAPVSRASLRREIVAKVKLAAAAPPGLRSAPPASVALAAMPAVAAARPAPRPDVRPAARPEIGGVVVIGASTGGPRAIGQLLGQLSPDFGLPCVIIQHLPATFTDPFAAQLERFARLPVQVAEAGHRLDPGVALVAPGSHHLVFRPDGRVQLQPPTDKDVYRPSIDLAMISAADAYGSSAVGVVLTGSGDDGAEGLKRIRDAGGEAYVQDFESCVVRSMPERAVARAGSDHVHVGTPERIGVLLAARKRA